MSKEGSETQQALRDSVTGQNGGYGRNKTIKAVDRSSQNQSKWLSS